MKRKTQLFLESMNSVLNEKINKDNIEINKAIANPNLGKNKEKIKAAGYNLDQTDDGKVFGINNPKTGRWIDPSSYNKDEKGKVDFKGKLDTERPRTNTTARRKDDTIENKIPKSLKVGKDKYGNDLYNREDTESYSPNYRGEKKKSISTNINDYNKAVKDRDDSKKSAESNRKDLGYYEKKVADAQQNLDWANQRVSDYEKKSTNAENKRQEILNKARQRRVNKESSMNEDSYSEYSNVVNTINSSISKLDNTEDIQELLQNIIGICRDIAEDRGLMVESSLSESSKYNTKSKEDYENENEYEAALNDDMAIIANTFEDLEYKVNIDTTVEILKSRLDEIMNDIRKNMNI